MAAFITEGRWGSARSKSVRFGDVGSSGDVLSEISPDSVSFAPMTPRPALPSPPSSPDRGRSKVLTLASVEHPGVEVLDGVESIRAVPGLDLSHQAMRSAVFFIAGKDPTLLQQRPGLARLAREPQTATIIVAVFWAVAMDTRRAAFVMRHGLAAAELAGVSLAEARDLQARAPVRRAQPTAVPAKARDETPEMVEAAARRCREVCVEAWEVAFRVGGMAFGELFGKALARLGRRHVRGAASGAPPVPDDAFARFPLLVAKTAYYLLTAVFPSSDDHAAILHPRLRDTLYSRLHYWATGVAPQNAQLLTRSPWVSFERRDRDDGTIDAADTTTFDARRLARTLNETLRFVNSQYGIMDDSTLRVRFRPGGGRASATSFRSGTTAHGAVSIAPTAVMGIQAGPTAAVDPTAVAPRPHQHLPWYAAGQMGGRRCDDGLPELDAVGAAHTGTWHAEAQSPWMRLYLERRVGVKTATLVAVPPPEKRTHSGPVTPRSRGGGGGGTGGMAWTPLSARDIAGEHLAFAPQTAAAVGKAADTDRALRKATASSNEAARASWVAERRAARNNEARAVVAQGMIQRMYCSRHPATLELVERLSGGLENALQAARRSASLRRKGGAEGGNHVDAVMKGTAALRTVAQHLVDIPPPHRAAVAALSMRCFREVRRLQRENHMLFEEEVSKRHAAHVLLTPADAAALEQQCSAAVRGDAVDAAVLTGLVQSSQARCDTPASLLVTEDAATTSAHYDVRSPTPSERAASPKGRASTAPGSRCSTQVSSAGDVPDSHDYAAALASSPRPETLRTSLWLQTLGTADPVEWTSPFATHRAPTPPQGPEDEEEARREAEATHLLLSHLSRPYTEPRPSSTGSALTPRPPSLVGTARGSITPRHMQPPATARHQGRPSARPSLRSGGAPLSARPSRGSVTRPTTATDDGRAGPSKRPPSIPVGFVPAPRRGVPMAQHVPRPPPRAEL